MNYIKTFKDKIIRIPMLQRDYVQGGKESIISPFIDSLLDVGHTSDLNYIYGYTEQGYFVPVDGQQRLTTLWLLYLYAAAKADKMKDFTVDFTFLSREYAEDFCKRLKVKMKEVLSKTDKNTHLDNAIREQYWFINSWNKNATVRNMLLTLGHIHRKCAERDANELWQHLLSDNSITFAFLDMSESNGLDDDIYIKMNGRGRPLSVFENLKSWMDERINNLIDDSKKNDEPWLHSWIKNIDNRWTRFFWDNRNRNQSHPEEIDDEQLFCFCNLLILFWMKGKDKLKNNIRSIKEKDPYLFEQLVLLFPQSKETDGASVITDYLFDKIQKGDLPSLIWIERLNLMPLEFLRFAYNSLEKLSDVYAIINNLGLYFGKTTSDVKPIYDLALSESSYGRTLPLLYAVLQISDGKNAKEWMRVCRNLILNTDIDKEKLPDILSCLDSFAERASKSNVYDVLKSYNRSQDYFLGSFNRGQVVEECKKASLSLNFYPQMELMENERFFSGKIYCLFRLLNHNDRINDYSLADFIDCSNVLMNIFYAGNGNDGGIRKIYDTEDKRLLRRTLMSLPPYYYGYRNVNWCFCANMEEWRHFLNYGKNDAFESLRHFIIEICLPALRKATSDLGAVILNCMRSVIAEYEENYEEKVDQNDNVDKYSLHFVHHVGVWNYMKTSRCDWREHDKHGLHIFLKTSNGNNSNKMELRTYSLFLDYADTSIHEDLKCDRSGWTVGLYQRENTCMYFQIYDPQSKRTIAIDVFHNCGKENDYALNVFLRPTIEEENNQTLYAENNQNYFSANLEIASQMHIGQNHRYLTNDTYSRKEIILLLSKLLPAIKKHIGK